MNITLARIDDRLIHGQVTTVWSKVANAQHIIICNDEVYNDEVRRTLLRQAAPPGMKVNVVNIEKAVAVYHNPQYQDETVFYLFTRPRSSGSIRSSPRSSAHTYSSRNRRSLRLSAGNPSFRRSSDTGGCRESRSRIPVPACRHHRA